MQEYGHFIGGKGEAVADREGLGHADTPSRVSPALVRRHGSLIARLRQKGNRLAAA